MKKMFENKILLTGASGFIGKSLLLELIKKKMIVRPAYRSGNNIPDIFLDDAVVVPTLDAATDWTIALKNVQVVVHAAARAHVMKEKTKNSLAEYRRINVDGTVNFARQAAKAGVKRFIFISSIKVNGESTLNGRKFKADDEPSPEDAYGLSKREAEDELWQIAKETGMEVVVIRPVLVYGPGVKGNFASMQKIVSKGIPLPFAAITENRRSLVSLDNLLSLIVTCIQHPRAAGHVFLAADGEDVSTAELIRRIARAQGKSARLLWVPVSFMLFAARLLGKGPVVQRLIGSLQVDIEKNRQLLGWQPVLNLDEGLYRSQENV